MNWVIIGLSDEVKSLPEPVFINFLLDSSGTNFESKEKNKY